MDPSYTSDNRLKPAQNDRRFTDDIFNFIFIFYNFINPKFCQLFSPLVQLTINNH